MPPPSGEGRSFLQTAIKKRPEDLDVVALKTNLLFHNHWWSSQLFFIELILFDSSQDSALLLKSQWPR